MDPITSAILELAKTALLLLFGGATVLQITPIKINPWSWLARRIGRAINGEVLTKQDALGKDLADLRFTVDERAAKDSRIRILRFGDEILHGREHSKEHFDQILQDITEYDQYCKSHPNFKNNMTQITTQKIMETYAEVWENRAFK